MSERRHDLGFAAGMHAMRSRGLLRLVARQTRDKAFPQNTSSRHAFGYAGGAMDLVLRARGRRRTVSIPCLNSVGLLVLWIRSVTTLSSSGQARRERMSR